MFFSACLGGERSRQQWRAALDSRAAASRLTQTVTVRKMGAGNCLALAWLGPSTSAPAVHVRETDRFTFVKPLAALSPRERALEEAGLRSVVNEWDCPDVRVLFEAEDATITVTIPVATPQQIYWTCLSDGLVLADDLRVIAALRRRDLDARAVYALFQYGLTPPPLTLFRGVSRLPGGHVSRLSFEPCAITSTPMVPPSSAHGPAIARKSAKDWLAQRLDERLGAVPADAALYFSGGVDSALLALRLKKMGRRDVRLINYTFGPGDQESSLATEMAAHLGMTCTRVMHDPSKVADVLGRVGSDYAFPFGDLSTIPTNILAHESGAIAERASTMIEGTGADGGFGLACRYPAWTRVYSIPAAVRRSIATAYRCAGLWKNTSDLGRVAGFVTRSARLCLGPAVIAQNALDGIAYRTPPAIASELQALLTGHVRALGTGCGQAELSLLDITMVCAGTMAPKSFDPLRTRGFKPVYPYLDPPVVHGGSSLPAQVNCTNGVGKSVLKALVAEELPRQWVYRPKSGFTPPYRAMFAAPPLQRYLRDVALDARNPLLDFCDVRAVTAMVDRAAASQPLYPAVHDFLWTLAFASGWIAALTPPPPEFARS
jgi:asparagine synthetase B (glutamine-hydrolysing)